MFPDSKNDESKTRRSKLSRRANKEGGDKSAGAASDSAQRKPEPTVRLNVSRGAQVVSRPLSVQKKLESPPVFVDRRSPDHQVQNQISPIQKDALDDYLDSERNLLASEPINDQYLNNPFANGDIGL